MTPDDVTANGGRSVDGRGLVMFVHGLWLTPAVWRPWVRLFDDNGYDAVFLDWPGPTHRSGARNWVGAAATTGELLRVAITHASSLPAAPIVIGHGYGGTIAQMLIDRAPCTAAIALAPAPVRAELCQLLTPVASDALHSGWFGADRLPTERWFCDRYATTLPAQEALALFQQVVTPGRIITTTVGRPGRGQYRPTGPLLLVSGGSDRLVPEASVSRLLRRHRRTRPHAVTDHHIIPDRSHTLTFDAGWQDVAELCLDWLMQHNL